jgi:hypothetical protein
MEAKKTLEMYSFSGKVSDSFLEALREYVESLPDDLKNTYIIMLSKGIVVKRANLYQFCKEHPEFALEYAKLLSK